MGTLKYAILGLLNRKNMTGYDLSKEFETTLFEFWNAKHSQIYPELKKLTQEGMLTYEEVISGTALKKKIYTITEAGRRDFLEWLAEDQPMCPTPKDIFRLRVFFSDELSAEQRLKMFESHLAQHRLRLAYLQQQMEKFDGVPEGGSAGQKSAPGLGDYLVLTGAIMREENTCQWLKRCMEIIGGQKA